MRRLTDREALVVARAIDAALAVLLTGTNGPRSERERAVQKLQAFKEATDQLGRQGTVQLYAALCRAGRQSRSPGEGSHGASTMPAVRQAPAVPADVG